MKKLYFLSLTFLIPLLSVGQIVNIPDPNLKAALIANTEINTNRDEEIQNSEAQIFSGELNVSELEISDMTGLEAFVSISKLDCSHNFLSNLNVSSNIKLRRLYCNSNDLSSLSVSENKELIGLTCDWNDLESLDVSENKELSDLRFGWNNLESLDVSSNVALTNLYCRSNQIKSLDLSKNINLMYLDCENNQLSNLDVTSNKALSFLSCISNNLTNLDVSMNRDLKSLYFYSNLLSSLDVSSNPNLEALGCNSNQLSSLDVSSNTNLEFLSCTSNQLSGLDLTANNKLIYVLCSSNQLSSFDIRNGNNSIIEIFKAENNPSLLCINVDDVDYATTNWKNIDDGVSFSYNCGGVTGLEDTQTKSFLCYPNPTSTTLTLDFEPQMEYISITNSHGRQILEKKRINNPNGRLEIDVLNFDSGEYIISLSNNETSIVEKILIVK